MTGASDEHNRIVFNLAREIGNALRGRRCEAFMSDMKLKLPPNLSDVFYYPDVLVACDPADNARYYRERPTVIFEVVSESTRSVDEREKVFAYYNLPSLKDYVIVEQDKVAVTVLHRAESGWDRERVSGPGAILKLDSIDVQIPLSAIYERTAVLQASPV